MVRATYADWRLVQKGRHARQSLPVLKAEIPVAVVVRKMMLDEVDAS